MWRIQPGFSTQRTSNMENLLKDHPCHALTLYPTHPVVMPNHNPGWHDKYFLITGPLCGESDQDSPHKGPVMWKIFSGIIPVMLSPCILHIVRWCQTITQAGSAPTRLVCTSTIAAPQTPSYRDVRPSASKHNKPTQRARPPYISTKSSVIIIVMCKSSSLSW